MQYPLSSAGRTADMVRARDEALVLQPQGTRTGGNVSQQTTALPIAAVQSAAISDSRPPGLPIESRQASLLPGVAIRRRGHTYITTAVTTPLRADARRHLAPEAQVKDAAAEAKAQPSEVGAELLPRAIRAANGFEKLPRWASKNISDFSSGLDSSSRISWQSPETSNASTIRYAPDVFLQAQHQTLQAKYEVKACLGESKGCAVYTVESKASGRTYACKVLDKVDHETKALLKEIELLKKLDHPNIVKIYEILEDAESLFLVMELSHGGDLCDRICAEDHLSEVDARVVMKQVLDALAYCHAKRVVHRDVKPENFLLATQDPKDLTLKLTDFGISTAIRPANLSHSSGSQAWPSFCESTHDGAGSLPYMAPEMFCFNVPEKAGQSDKCDLWSAGVVLYFALSGQFPFGNDADVTPGQICCGKPVEFKGDCWRHISNDAKDLIKKLLNHDVAQRLSARQALEHKWFRRHVSPLMETCQDVAEASNMDCSPHRAAIMLYHALSSWQRQPQLRRWAIAAMAGQLPEDCETQRLAKMIYKMFSDSSNTLKCERLIDVLSEVQAEALAEVAEPSPQCSSVRSWKSMLQEGDVSKQEVKQKLKEVKKSWKSMLQDGRDDLQSVFKRLASLPETPTAETPCSDSQSTASPDGPLREDVCDMVGAVDGNKSGRVSYTLLVAALLPEHVYCDDLRIVEIFNIFDVRGRGRIKPRDLRAALQCPKNYKGRFSQMIEDYDRDGDGAIDLADFRAMVRGETAKLKTAR